MMMTMMEVEMGPGKKILNLEWELSVCMHRGLYELWDGV